MIKRVFGIFLIIVSLLISSVYAEQTLHYTVTVNKEETSIVQEEANEYIDSSDVNVKVIQYKNDIETVIYQGKLGNYDNGLWNYTDFNKLQFLVIFDWSDTEKEPIYIIPENNLISTGISGTESNALMSIENQGEIENNLSLIYNDKYYEKQLILNNQIKIETIIKNTKDASENISVIVASYNNDNKLIETSMSSAIINNTGEYLVVSTDIDVPSVQNGYVKAYIWNGQNLKPYELPQMISQTKEDYYSNDFETAVLIDENREIIGKIDTQTDIDYLKFIANCTGEYVLKINSENGVICNLYNENQELISTSVNGALSANLIVDNKYMIKISGNQAEDYSINVLYISNRDVLSRDTLVNGSLSAGNVKTYEFTPTENNNFVFTAIGPKKLKARLFDSTYNLIDEDSEGDDNVAYRVHGELLVGQKYYITVISDWDLIGAANYTENTEIPMELLTIE